VEFEPSYEWILGELRRVDAKSPIGSTAHSSYLYPEYRDDLLGFIANVLGDRTWKGSVALWRGQRAIAESVQRNKVTGVYSSRGTGKDHALARLILALFYTRPCRILCLAPSMRQLQEILFAQISKSFNGATQKLEGDLQTMKLKLPGDASHYILGIPAADPERARGFHAGVECPGDPDQDEMTEEDMLKVTEMLEAGAQAADEVYIIVDEPEGVSEEVFRVLEGTMSKPGTRMVLIGNPAQGLFDDHTYPRLLRSRPAGSHTINLSSVRHADFGDENAAQLAMFDEVFDEVPGWLVPHAARDKARRDYHSQDPIFLSDWRGLFSEDAMESQVIPLNALNASVEYYASHRTRRGIGPRIGVDLGFGGDASVATLMVDGVVCSTHSWRSSRDDRRMQVTTAEVLRDLFMFWGDEVSREYPESWDGGAIVGQRVSIDETGLSGVSSILYEMGIEVDRVDFGGAFRGDPTGLVDGGLQMANQRAGMYWHARMGLQDGRYHIPDEERFKDYWEQLPWTLFERDGSRVKLESKKHTIKRHGHSPDFADSFVLACVPSQDRPVMWSTGGPTLSNSLLPIPDKDAAPMPPSSGRRDRRQWRRVQ